MISTQRQLAWKSAHLRPTRTEAGTCDEAGHQKPALGDVDISTDLQCMFVIKDESDDEVADRHPHNHNKFPIIYNGATLYHSPQIVHNGPYAIGCWGYKYPISPNPLTTVSANDGTYRPGVNVHRADGIEYVRTKSRRNKYKYRPKCKRVL